MCELAMKIMCRKWFTAATQEPQEHTAVVPNGDKVGGGMGSESDRGLPRGGD